MGIWSSFELTAVMRVSKMATITDTHWSVNEHVELWLTKFLKLQHQRDKNYLQQQSLAICFQ